MQEQTRIVGAEGHLVATFTPAQGAPGAAPPVIAVLSNSGVIPRCGPHRINVLLARELVTLLPLCVLMLWIGVAPRAFLEPSRPALEAVLSDYQARLDVPPVTVPALAPPRGDRATARTFVASGPESSP